MTARDDAPARLYTADEFEALLATPEYRDRRLELIDGEIVEKMPTEEHGVIAALIAHYLMRFVLPRRLGRVGVEIRVQLDDDPRNVRLPDVSFSRGTQPMRTRGSLTTAPELIVEIKSPDDRFRALRASASYYLAHGCRMVWLVFPQQRIVEVYTPEDDTVLSVDDTLTGGDVLPGFTLPVTEIFKDTQAAAPTTVSLLTQEG